MMEKESWIIINGQIAMLLTGILLHGTATNDFSISTVIRISKGKGDNLMDSTNYRGIPLSSVTFKVLELIVLTRYSDKLSTSDLQFGFKCKRSTNVFNDS